MTENQIKIIKKALIDTEREEARFYDSLPKVNMTHSEKYNKRIEKIFAKNDPRIIWMPRKVATVLIAASLIFALSVTAFAFRENIKDFFIDIYDTFVKITAKENDEEPLPDKIEKVYTIYGIPDGFEKIDDSADEVVAQQCWISDTGMIVLQQILAKDTEISSSNENSQLEETQLAGKTIFMIQENGSYTLYWSEAGYIFTLIVSDTISFESVKDMVKNIAPKEQ